MPPSSEKLGFSQKHPFLFGFAILAAAVVLIAGTTAVVRLWIAGDAVTLWGQDRYGLAMVRGKITSSKDFNKWIARLRDDDSVVGVVIRVDSPGGVIAPSQEMHRAVQRLVAKKPVVVSMGSVAASGGYYLACPASRIVANPGTITGSIGVKMELTVLEGLMEKLGIGHETLASGPLKSPGPPYAGLTPAAREAMESMITDMHEQFVEAVAAGRQLDIDHIRAIADGRALSGRQALELGLVDALGGQEEAFEALRELCHVEGRLPVLREPEKESYRFLDLLTTMLPLPPAGTLSREVAAALSAPRLMPVWEWSF